jgi:hypothetical protein
MEGVERNLLAKMPLAEAVWILWVRIANSERLQAVSDANRGRCYDLALTFPELARCGRRCVPVPAADRL